MEGNSVWGTDYQKNLEMARNTQDPEKLKRMVTEILQGSELDDEDGEILEELVRNRSVPFSDALELVQFDYNYHICVAALLQREDATPKALEDYLYHESDDLKFVHTIIATHRNTPQSLLLKMANSGCPSTITSAVMSGRLSESVLEGLTRNEDLNVREAIAIVSGNPMVLKQLSTDEIPEVRYAVAFNPRTELDVIEKMATDLDCRPARLAAAKRSANPDLLRWLAESLQTNFKADLADALKQNENAPEDVRVSAALMGPE